MLCKMKTFFYIFLLLFPLVVACSKQMSATSFDEYMMHHDLLYKEADIHEAEKLLLKLIDTVEVYRSKRVEGLNYEFVLYVTYTRLFLIHSKLGDEYASKKDLSEIKALLEQKAYDPSQIDSEIKRTTDFIRNSDIQHSISWIIK